MAEAVFANNPAPKVAPDPSQAQSQAKAQVQTQPQTESTSKIAPAAVASEQAAQSVKNSARAEKSAADQKNKGVSPRVDKEKIIFLVADDKQVAHVKTGAGTTVADDGEDMKL
ncbi:MAG: hypothetical protein ACREIA_23465, partial [Opitutaceae bacterium]